MGYNIKVETKDDALDLMFAMHKILEHYGSVTVHDVNDLIGQRSTYSDHRKGWCESLDVDLIEGRDGWFVRLPYPTDIAVNA